MHCSAIVNADEIEDPIELSIVENVVSLVIL